MEYLVSYLENGLWKDESCKLSTKQFCQIDVQQSTVWIEDRVSNYTIPLGINKAKNLPAGMIQEPQRHRPVPNEWEYRDEFLPILHGNCRYESRRQENILKVDQGLCTRLVCVCGGTYVSSSGRGESQGFAPDP